MYVVLLDDWAAGVHLYSIEMSLSQAQPGEGQQSSDVSADSSQTELHCQLSNWDSEVNNNSQSDLSGTTRR